MLRDLQVPHVYLFSEHLLPRPSDWGPQISVAGFLFLEEEKKKKAKSDKGEAEAEDIDEIVVEDEERGKEGEEEEAVGGVEHLADPTLVSFIRNARSEHAPLLYIGFGSIVIPDSLEKLRVIYRTLQRIPELRVVLSNVSILSLHLYNSTLMDFHLILIFFFSRRDGAIWGK